MRAAPAVVVYAADVENFDIPAWESNLLDAERNLGTSKIAWKSWNAGLLVRYCFMCFASRKTAEFRCDERKVSMCG